MIGLSLSLCISDILRGCVLENDVERIISATRFPDTPGLEVVIAQYQKTYWMHDPERGATLARKFYKSGIIDQPRLRNEPVMLIAMGHWAKDEQDVANWPRCK